jgi:hypothetical protein
MKKPIALLLHVVSRAAMPAACRPCSGACPAERPRSASGVKLGRVLINRPVVSAFGQTGHRAAMASGPRLTLPGLPGRQFAVLHNPHAAVLG